MIKKLITNCIWKAAALVLMASCTAEHPADENVSNLPEGMYPITFTATVADGNPATRLADDGTNMQFEEGDGIALKIGSEVREYKAKKDKSENLVFTSDKPFYYQKPTDKFKNIEAWYPYSPTKPSTISVQNNQSQGNNYSNSTILFSDKVSEVAFGQSLSLTFTPQVAKVIVNIKKQGALNNADMIEEVKINETIIAKKAQTTPNDMVASYEAVLAPVNINQNAPFVSIQVKGYGKRTYKMQAQTTLTAGQAYTYNIGVKDLPYITSNSNQTITVTDGEEITIKGNGTEAQGNITINMPGGGTSTTIHLDQVDIKNGEAITIQGGGTATIILENENILRGEGANSGGLIINGEDTHLAIIGKQNGKLTAYGTSHAAIGGRRGGACGNITIQDAEIEVHTVSAGYGGSAGIGTGSGYNRDNTRCGNITIINSTISGSTDGGGSWTSGAVIGTGCYVAGNQCGTITIQLKENQSIDDFLNNLTVTSGNAYKVGRGKDGKDPACTVVWQNYGGSIIPNEGERK